MLRDKMTHCSEKPTHRCPQLEVSPRSHDEDPAQAKKKPNKPRVEMGLVTTSGYSCIIIFPGFLKLQCAYESPRDPVRIKVLI